MAQKCSKKAKLTKLYEKIYYSPDIGNLILQNTVNSIISEK